MHQFCLQALYSNDFTTLKEIMLKFSYFLEISQQLTETQFIYIISRLKEETIVKHEPLNLQPSNIYFFFQKGAIYRKETMGKSEKSIRIRQKNRHLTNNKMVQKLPQIKESIAYQIDQFDSFEEKCYSPYRNVYYCFTSKPTIAIRLPLSDLSQEYRQLLRNHSTQKIKFLAQYGSSLNLEKHIITENIHKFQYLMLSFGQNLYHKQLRNQNIFFIKNGVVELHQGSKTKNKCIVNAKSVIGVQTTDQESARCISDKLECYIIKKEFLNRYFSKYSHKKQLFSQSTHNLMGLCKTGLNTPYAAELQPQIAQNKQLQFNRDKSFDSPSKQYLNRGRIGHSSVGSFRQRSGQKCRLFKLKQHFSNFYNEVFEEYSERKVQHMGLNLDNKENLVLYNIKVLQRKAPDMNEIKHKLSKIRLEKMRACKQKLRGDRHHHDIVFTQIMTRSKNQ